MHSKTAMSASGFLLWLGIIANLPALVLYYQESTPFLIYIPIAYGAFWYLIRRDLGEFGFSSESFRRKISVAGIYVSMLAAVAGGLIGSDKLGYYSAVCSAVLALMILRGNAPWTRVLACGLILLATCESLWGVQRAGHNVLANLCFNTASTILDQLGILHRLSADGLQTEIVSLPANRLICLYDNVWLACFIAIFISVYNRRPLFVGFCNVVASVLIYWVATSILVVSFTLVSSSSDLLLRNGAPLLHSLVVLKILLQAIWLSRCDRGIAYLSLPVPITTSDSKRGIFRSYRVFVSWPATERVATGEVAVGHEKLTGYRSPLPTSAEAETSQDPLGNSMLSYLPFLLGFASLCIWAIRILAPDLLPGLPL